MSVLRSAATGALLARAVLRGLTARPPGGVAHWERVNHRGRTVTLLSGPALVVAAGVSADLPRPAATVAAAGAALLGAYDDAVGSRAPDAKGLRGHLRALRQGRLTSGVVKAVGIPAVGLAACALLDDRDRRALLVEGAVVGGAANLLNLLDLRPGRALKAGTIAATLLGQPGPAAAALALLPDDLHERTMLGDAGANGLGALLGLSVVARAPRRRTPALAFLVTLTAASEVVSFGRVIDALPPLRWVDRAGRLP